MSSAALVALAEIGDKTMLLAIVLAARFKAPWPILAGILVATVANHALAAWAGAMVAGLLEGPVFRALVGLGFLAMAAWVLVPDAVDDEAVEASGRGAFLTTTVAFFLAEMGDKTQVATVALGAQHQAVLLVTVGTTIGMMVANGPAVFLGERMTHWVPLRVVRVGAALGFVAVGVWSLWQLV